MISSKILEKMKSSSWIRAMFEEGERLRRLHGAPNVFDFTLGNPYTEVPAEVTDSIIRLAAEKNSNIHKYMNNAGHLDVRQALAEFISREIDMSLDSRNIVMAVGAAGALNVILKTLLNPGDEVIILAPYFVEYLFYIDNHGGTPVVVDTVRGTFLPDIDAIEKSITPKTKAIIVNSPNNPTGVVYPEAVLRELSAMLKRVGKRLGTSIYLISDEPYREMVYSGAKVPNLLSLYDNTILAYSYSKSLSLAGERIGYIAVGNQASDFENLVAGLTFSTRILGFVNAPSLFQKVVKEIVGLVVDMSDYREKRDAILGILTELGFECPTPEGAFFLFPKSLVLDDVAFCKKAVEYNLLLVPGIGFGCPGYFRISYAVSMETIQNSREAFKKLVDAYK